MRNIDRIDEAFKGKMGTAMQKGSRSRIHWICSQAKGEKILDVGCSQGTASIILAREGKKVVGIDICQEGIDYANNLLEDEDASTCANASFVCSDFIAFSNESTEKYDSIIMTEILEHLADPERFVSRAFDMLVENGSLIVTVPFGINDYHDHKRTYYVTELYNILDVNFSIRDIVFFGDWIGMLVTKSDHNSILMDEKLFVETEKAFLEHESGILDNVKGLREKLKLLEGESEENLKKLSEANTKCRTISSNYAQLNIDFEAKQKELSYEKEKYSDLESNFQEKMLRAEEKYSNLEFHFEEEKNVFLVEIQRIESDFNKLQLEKEKLESELKNHQLHLDELSKENTELLEKTTLSTTELGNSLKQLNNLNSERNRLKSQVSLLQKEISTYKWKLNLITDTWYGKLAIRVYKLLSKIKRRIKG